MFSLEGKTAIVTGSGGGIGKGIAAGLAAAGADIVIGEIDNEKMISTAEEIRRGFKVRVLEVETDVQREDQVEEMVNRTISTFGTVDILVNNAGIGIRKLPQEMSIEEWDRNININLRAVFMCSKAVFPVMKKRKKGKIINIGSLYSIFGSPNMPAYAASKGGVVQFTKSLAIAWAVENIQVNAIVPGWINTDLSAGAKRARPDIEQAVISRTPSGRWGEPEDIAGAAVFLSSPASDFITGIALPVDGGYSTVP